MSTFTPLRVHSNGSLLYGTAAPEALIERALALGYEALALTDRDNLYLAIRTYQAARADGLRPLIGATVTLDGARDAVLLPLDRRGYAHLCALLTRRMLEPAFDLVAALAPQGGDHPAAGLHVIVESPALAAALLAAGVPAARGAELYAGARARGGDAGAGSGGGGVWIGIRGIASERRQLAERVTAARALGLPLVATGDCVLLDAADHDVHRAAVTAAHGELLERMPAAAFCARDAVLDSPAGSERRVRAVCGGAALPAAAEEALAHNLALAERCRLEFELGVPFFPSAPLPRGVSGIDHLRGLCEAGIARRYASGGAAPAAAARARLSTELAMIERMAFTDYFLLVAEIVGFSRARGIPTAGRGSGASSIVAYLLGITNVDPIRYGLHFERFLNPTRRDCPDLDIDLCWRRRDEVIAHVYEAYGADRVAMISTHATLGARSGFREAAKALGIANAHVNGLARLVPRELEAPYTPRLAQLADARRVDWTEPTLARALQIAERLDGAPRHLSIHCGGVVIADRPLTHYVPLERSAKGVIVTQFEMRAIEAIGLVKMDLLGNHALTTLGECIDLARARRPAASADYDRALAPTLDLDAIPDPDPATVAHLAAGDTLNCFQLESPAMRHLLRMMRVASLDETIAAVALVRPGPAESGMKEAYCRRARGLEAVTVHHPRLEVALRATFGLMLYEEDVMRVAAALTGMTLAQGDDLRRAIGHARGDEAFRSLERGFIAHAARAGVDAEPAHAVWRDLTRFAAYAFCKAHAAGYGTLGYQAAYLKTHFPLEYAVAILNHHAGMYATWVHVEDLRRRGVAFRAPCAQRSAWDATLEPDRTEAGAGAVRVGLSRVFGLHETTAARIVAARERAPFRSLADFMARVRPALPEVETLAYAGALDWTHRTRPSLLLEARAGAKAWGTQARARGIDREAWTTPQALVEGREARAVSEHDAAPRDWALALATPDGSALAPDPVTPLPIPALPEFDLAARVRGELIGTGLWFAAHPLDVLVPQAAAVGAVPAATIEALSGRRVTVLGMPCAYRRVSTKAGEAMLFMTLADRSGLAECVLFPDVYRRYARATQGRALRATGRVHDTLGAFAIDVERLEPLA